MLTRDAIQKAFPHAFVGLGGAGPEPQIRGKVRDIYFRDGQRVLVTTDRLSAFDRVLGPVPYKGQVLNELSAFWFNDMADLIPNHMISLPDPNVMVVQECEALPVEVIVRGYISGVTQTALWYRYSQGERQIYGYSFPDGLRKNQLLPAPIITPTTKGGPTGHDERLTCQEVVENGLVAPALWERVQEAALAVFRRGQEVALGGGLILVDTKYEFGLAPDGELVLIDEVHTPDSSRFWKAESYEERLAAGEEPENFDKEFVRLWYTRQGYRGDGEPPAWNAELAIQGSERYIAVYEMLSRQSFRPAPYPAQERVLRALGG